MSFWKAICPFSNVTEGRSRVAVGLQFSRRPEIPQPHDGILHLEVSKSLSVPGQRTPIVDRHFDSQSFRPRIFSRSEVRFEVMIVHPEEFRQLRRTHPPLSEILLLPFQTRLCTRSGLGRPRGSSGFPGIVRQDAGKWRG